MIQWVFIKETLDRRHQHHQCRLNNHWQNFTFVAPRPISKIARQWESPNSDSIQVCIDLHIIQWVFIEETLDGCHQHHQCILNNPWQSLFFVSPRPISKMAAQWESPNSDREQVSIDLHIIQWVFIAETLDRRNQHHQCILNNPWQSFIFVSPRPISKMAAQWESPNSDRESVHWRAHNSVGDHSRNLGRVQSAPPMQSG
jgi:8-oxo-dGTP pyrophosphatase MutT (NUDIX family)